MSEDGIHAADALMEIFGLKRVTEDERKEIMLKAMEQASEEQREVIRKAEREREEKRNQEMLRYSPDESISL